MPGVGVPAAAFFLAETLGRTIPASSLPDCADLMPLNQLTRRSGSSIRADYISHAGNRRLKRDMFLAAFASLRSDPASGAYHDRKRAQRNRHNQAIIALAHRHLTCHMRPHNLDENPRSHTHSHQ
ncbi:Transposase IS116/IS110/IS902 family protein [Actinomyces ruminicola]|uniref:Transposase IS116/IS110/IS902 family protein n=1 Tax=Actinomyces ruminicola TaxID=332524 RepID=A0A1G9S749_9ACTO|nr:Transposase IS116/IS110/IS902 family protein [Actinomyces ruminicola]